MIGDGKTAQLGELAEHIYATTKKITRLYSSDRGGWLTVDPYVKLGIIEVIPLFGNPWLWLNHAVKGDVPQKKENGVYLPGPWVSGNKTTVGLHAYESATSIADELMAWMAQETSKGKQFGEGGIKFTVQEGSEKLDVGGNGRSHYQIAQKSIMEKVWLSQSVGTASWWSFAARRAADEDPNTTGQVLGPQVAGKALTAEIPRWFKYTFHVMAEPQLQGAPKHVLYLEDHKSQEAGMSKAVANARNPLAGEKEAPTPVTVEPASVVKALEILKKRQNVAVDVIKKRLGMA